MSRRENGGEEMADRPEAAIQAILIGLLDMQQLNLNLAERLAVEELLLLLLSFIYSHRQPIIYNFFLNPITIIRTVIY